MLLIDTDSDIDPLLVVDPPTSDSDNKSMKTWPFVWVSWDVGRPLTVDAAFPVLTPGSPLFHSSKGRWHSGLW